MRLRRRELRSLRGRSWRKLGRPKRRNKRNLTRRERPMLSNLKRKSKLMQRDKNSLIISERLRKRTEKKKQRRKRSKKRSKSLIKRTISLKNQSSSNESLDDFIGLSVAAADSD